MRFVYKQNVAAVEICEDGSQIAHALKRRAGGDFDLRREFVRNQMRERRLAKPRWAIKQQMLYRVSALARRLQQNGKITLDVLLPDIIVPLVRTKRRVKRAILQLFLRLGRGGRAMLVFLRFHTGLYYIIVGRNAF